MRGQGRWRSRRAADSRRGRVTPDFGTEDRISPQRSKARSATVRPQPSLSAPPRLPRPRNTMDTETRGRTGITGSYEGWEATHFSVLVFPFVLFLLSPCSPCPRVPRGPVPVVPETRDTGRTGTTGSYEGWEATHFSVLVFPFVLFLLSPCSPCPPCSPWSSPGCPRDSALERSLGPESNRCSTRPPSITPLFDSTLCQTLEFLRESWFSIRSIGDAVEEQN